MKYYRNACTTVDKNVIAMYMWSWVECHDILKMNPSIQRVKLSRRLIYYALYYIQNKDMTF